jgi:hypothetical protein
MSKLFEAPMAAHPACCDESTVLTDYTSSDSSSDRSASYAGDRHSNVHKVRPKCTKQRRDKPPVKTIQFQTHSFSDVMSYNSKKAKEEEVGISSYLQLQVIYPACVIESETASRTPIILKTGHCPPTSALAQLHVAWFLE